MHRGFFGLIFLLACSSEPAAPPAPLRPGVQNSSVAYMGSPSAPEAALWEAVRDADPAARTSAIAAVKDALANDPDDGYGAFLLGSTAFIQGADLIAPLASGQPVSTAVALPELSLPADTQSFLKQSLAHLTDPFYIGIAATLLAIIQGQSDAASAAQTQQLADSTNFVASSVGKTTSALVVGDAAGALSIMYDWLKYCDDGKLDPAAPDLDAFVDAANTGVLAQRECYSGYYAMHATEGELLQIGDLYAIAGNQALANLYYGAMPRATNYASWPLKALAERRIDGTQPATSSDLVAVIACATCHINQVQ